MKISFLSLIIHVIYILISIFYVHIDWSKTLRKINLTFSKQTGDKLIFHSKRLEGICKGDSGSGLYIESDGPKYVDKILVGIMVYVELDKKISGFTNCAMGPNSDLHVIPIFPNLGWIIDNMDRIDGPMDWGLD